MLALTTMLEKTNDIGVPDTATPGPLGVSVVPATTVPSGSTVRTWPMRVNVCITADRKGVGSGKLLAPITISDGARETRVPEMVIAGPSSLNVVPATATPSGPMLKTLPSSATIRDGVDEEGVGSVRLDDPITICELPTENSVPDTVAAGPFRWSVVPSVESPSGASTIVWLARTTD